MLILSGSERLIKGYLDSVWTGLLISIRKHSETTAPLVQLVDDLYQRGVRRIDGNVIGDDSYFAPEQFGVGWQWNDLQWYFGAEPALCPSTAMSGCRD